MDRSLYLGYCEEIFSFPHWAVLEIELGSQHTPSPCSASKPHPQPLLLLFLVLNIAAEKSYGTLGFCFISWYYKPTKTKQTKDRTKDFWKPHTWLITHTWPITVAILWGTSSLFSSPFSSCLFPSAMWLLSVLVCFLLLIKKKLTQSSQGEERVCFILQLMVHHQEKSRQELKKRQHRGKLLTDLLLMSYLVFFLIHPCTRPPAQGFNCPQWAAPSHINH